MSNVDGQQMRVEMLSDELAASVVVKRISKDPGGYQRDQSENKVLGVIEAARKGSPVPPIIIVQTETGYECLDGQHRLEAWKRAKFPLGACIVKKNGFSVGGAFCAINGNQTRVSLSLRLKVDDNKEIVRLREFAERFKMNVHQAYSIVAGATPGRTLRLVNEESWRLASKAAKVWRNDKRWNNPSSYYSKGGTLQLVGWFARTSTGNLEQTLTVLKQMDFSKTGTFRELYGCNSKNQTLMRNRAMKFILSHQPKAAA